jgi:hypothetical protein
MKDEKSVLQHGNVRVSSGFDKDCVVKKFSHSQKTLMIQEFQNHLEFPIPSVAGSRTSTNTASLWTKEPLTIKEYRTNSKPQRPRWNSKTSETLEYQVEITHQLPREQTSRTRTVGLHSPFAP